MLKRDIALIDELRNRPAEESCIEFKKDNTNPEVIGKLCSALSNKARIDGQDCAYVLWGIQDETHQITGTAFNPETKKSQQPVISTLVGAKTQTEHPIFIPHCRTP